MAISNNHVKFQGIFLWRGLKQFTGCDQNNQLPCEKKNHAYYCSYLQDKKYNTEFYIC